MKIWVDDMRKPPEGYTHVNSVWEAVGIIQLCLDREEEIEVLDLDHDAGFFNFEGGDYIEILKWLEATGKCNFPIAIHSMNVVGVINMESIILHNKWKYVKSVWKN